MRTLDVFGMIFLGIPALFAVGMLIEGIVGLFRRPAPIVEVPQSRLAAIAWRVFQAAVFIGIVMLCIPGPGEPRNATYALGLVATAVAVFATYAVSRCIDLARWLARIGRPRQAPYLRPLRQGRSDRIERALR